MVEAAEGTVESRFLVASVVLAGAAVRVVLVVGRLMVLVRDGTELVAVAGFRMVEVAVEDVADGFVVVREGDPAVLGTVDVRRAAAEVMVRFFSSSEADGWERWLSDDVVVVVGFRTVLVVPAGGRVGGLVKPLMRLVPVVPAAAAVREAVVVVVPGRRTADVVVLGRLAAVPSLLVVLVVDLAVDLGDSTAAVSVVPVVSSPERIDSSAWEASKTSASDMVAAVVLCYGCVRSFVDARPVRPLSDVEGRSSTSFRDSCSARAGS